MNYFRTPGCPFGDLHIQEGDDHVGALKYFDEGIFSGRTMAYYYSQHRSGHKASDNASDVFSIWENLDDILSIVSKDQTVLKKHIPIANRLLINTLLLASERIPTEQADAWLWPDRLTDPSGTNYTLYVTIRGDIKVTEDIIVANTVDINKAHPATQMLIRLSMALDQEFMSGRIRQVRQAIR
jgi:hypothetical protein